MKLTYSHYGQSEYGLKLLEAQNTHETHILAIVRFEESEGDVVHGERRDRMPFLAYCGSVTMLMDIIKTEDSRRIQFLLKKPKALYSHKLISNRN